jgi:uncharacterized membrane protein
LTLITASTISDATYRFSVSASVAVLNVPGSSACVQTVPAVTGSVSALIRETVPPPDYFAEYKEVEPSAPDRILRMAELEQSHRHDVDSALVNSQVANNNQEIEMLLSQQKFDNEQAQKGLYFAFLIAIIFLGMGFYLILNNKSIEGFASIAVVVSGIIANFIFVNKEKNKILPKINSSSKPEKQNELKDK